MRCWALACALLFLAGSASAERFFHIVRTAPCQQIMLGHRGHPYLYKADEAGVIAVFEPDLMEKAVDLCWEDCSEPWATKDVDFTEIFVMEGGETILPGVSGTGCGVHDSLLPGVSPAGSPAAVPLPPYFTIQVFDRKLLDERKDCRFTVFPGSPVSPGCGVPGVKVTVEEPGVSPHWKTFVTDSNGVVAFYDPQLMAGNGPFEICFSLYAEGYYFEQPDECLTGNGGLELQVTPGGIAQIGAIRLNISERMYRLTGRGVYRDSIMLGLPVPPVPNVLAGQGLVTGQDTTQSAVYQGEIRWIWGDSHSLWRTVINTRVSGAVSQLPSSGGLDPAVGVDLDYFVDATGFSRGMAPPSAIPVPVSPTVNLFTWIVGLFVVPDQSGHERLLANYLIPPNGPNRITGVARFNDASEQFERVFSWTGQPVRSFGQGFAAGNAPNEYVYFANEGLVNTVRGRATAEVLEDPLAYEAFSPLRNSEGGALELDRLEDGSLRYTWKHGAPPLSNLTSYGPVSPEEALFGHMRDPRPGAHAFGRHGEGSTSWNEHRKRFVQIINEIDGTSDLAYPERFLYLGELWYAEADTPMGPWVYGRKATLYNNTYERNPRLHSFLDQEGGRFIFFDATFKSGEPALFPQGVEKITPSQRDHYNAIMYRLDLESPRLVLPLPIYDRSAATVPGDFADNRGLRPGMADAPAAFFAQDRATDASASEASAVAVFFGLAIPTVPVHWSGAACAHPQLLAGGTPVTRPVFHALPPDAPADPARQGLYEFVHPITGAYAYSVADSLAGYERAAEPLAVVWRNPISIPLPVSDYLPALIADAGADACLHAVSNAPGATIPVTLDASASLHQVGTIQSYTWNRWHKDAEGERGELLGTGPVLQVSLTQDIHPILLTVTDDAGRSSTDSVVVQIDAPLDTDGDLVIDSYDNCLNVPNAVQIDSNQDGYGNACDADYDGNGVVGETDFATFQLAFGSYVGDPNYNPDCDHTGEGVVGMADYGVFANSFGQAPGPSGLACAGAVPCLPPSP